MAGLSVVRITGIISPDITFYPQMGWSISPEKSGQHHRNRWSRWIGIYTESGKVKRFYSLQIKDFSSKSLRPIFDQHISKEAQVTTDEWKDYRPLTKGFKITQVPSEMGLNFKALHTLIH